MAMLCHAHAPCACHDFEQPCAHFRERGARGVEAPAACSEALAKRLPLDQPVLPSAGEVTGDHAGPCKGWYLLVDNAEIK